MPSALDNCTSRWWRFLPIGAYRRFFFAQGHHSDWSTDQYDCCAALSWRLWRWRVWLFNLCAMRPQNTAMIIARVLSPIINLHARLAYRSDANVIRDAYAILLSRTVSTPSRPCENMIALGSFVCAVALGEFVCAIALDELVCAIAYCKLSRIVERLLRAVTRTVQ